MCLTGKLTEKCCFKKSLGHIICEKKYHIENKKTNPTISHTPSKLTCNGSAKDLRVQSAGQI